MHQDGNKTEAGNYIHFETNSENHPQTVTQLLQDGY